MKKLPVKPTTISLCILALMLALAACNVSLPEPERIASPTPEILRTTVAPTETPAEPTITLTPSRTVPPVPVLESPTASPTQGPPTATWTTTPTLGPYEHTIVQGDSLITIIQRYGYTDLSVIDQIVAINANIPNADSLPGAGAVILVPRQTATPTPEGFTPSPTAEGQLPNAPTQSLLMEHRVLQGETIVGIAGQYNTSLRMLDQLNPELLFFNCDFENPSGGPDCNVPLSVDQRVQVPAPTPTLTVSPTPDGNETATPTPTFAAPILSFPPEGGVAQGDRITLQWVSTGILPPDLYYLVEIEDTTTGATHLEITRNNSYTIESSLAPQDDQQHAMRWRVRVGTQTEAGAFRPVSSEGAWRTFQWKND